MVCFGQWVNTLYAYCSSEGFWARRDHLRTIRGVRSSPSTPATTTTTTTKTKTTSGEPSLTGNSERLEEAKNNYQDIIYILSLFEHRTDGRTTEGGGRLVETMELLYTYCASRLYMPKCIFHPTLFIRVKVQEVHRASTMVDCCTSRACFLLLSNRLID